MRKLYAALAVAAFAASTGVHAATLAHYKAKCRLTHGAEKAFDQWCDVGVGPETAEGKVMVYAVTLPDGHVATVREWRNGMATVDGVPARNTAFLAGWFHYVTAEDEHLVFARPPADLQF